MKSFVGIDIGTTSVCAVKADADDGACIDIVRAPNDAALPSAKPWERLQSPERIFETAASLLEKTGVADAVSIGFSCQMHGILYIDGAGRAVSPLYTWQDSRGDLPYRDGKTYAEAFGAPSGYGLVTDFCNRENGLVPPEARQLCSIGDYVVMRLCGLSRPLTHATVAASFGGFDLESGEFKNKTSFLPEVTDSPAAAGAYRGVPVSVCIGDNQASCLGAGLTEDAAAVNIGTGSQVSVLSRSPSPSPLLETRPFGTGRYLLAGCALCGGRAFADAARFIAECASLVTGESYDNIYPAADAFLAGYSGEALRVDTRFCGTRLDPSARGSIKGIGEGSLTPGAFLTGVMRGIAEELHEMYLASGVNAAKLLLSGNGVRKNPALRRVISEVFGKETLVPACGEEAAFGAALSGLAGAGLIREENTSELVKYTDGAG